MNKIRNMNDDEYPPEVIRSLEIQLSRMDEAFQAFAIMTGGSVSVYTRDCPIREVEFKDEHGLSKRIFLQPGMSIAETKGATPPYRFILAMAAWKDEPGGRWEWHKQKDRFEHLPETFEEQFGLLEECLQELKAISLRDLTFERVPGRITPTPRDQ
jgi:hypothetical protein